MERSSIPSLALAACLLALGAPLSGSDPAGSDPGRFLAAWVESPLHRVFIHTPPPAADGPSFVPRAARNEHVAFQVALRLAASDLGLEEMQSGFTAIRSVRADAGPLIHEKGSFRIPAERIRVRAVGNVPVRHPLEGRHAYFRRETDGPPQRPYPHPDILRETDRLMNVVPDVSRSFWIDLVVPREAPAGAYEGTVRLEAPGLRKIVPVRLVVHAVELPEKRSFYHAYQLWAFDHVERAYPDRPRFSDGWWSLMDRIAANMASHRYTCVTVQAVQLVEPALRDGVLAFDFARLDRFLDLFKKRGIDWVHLYPIMERKQLWRFEKREEDVGYLIQEPDADGRWGTVFVPKGDPRAERFHRPFLRALERHFTEKGWTGTTFLQVMDEEQPELTVGARTMHREECPRLLDDKRMDWVHLWWKNETGREAARRGKKRMMLYVTAPAPGYPAGDVIEERSLNQIVLRWLCPRWKLSGYGFWAYNQGWISPADLAEEPSGGLSPATYPFTGNTFVVYPGPDGPLDSIRHEAGLDGVEDVELLALLAARDPERADALLARMIPDMDAGDFVRDAAVYEGIRRELLEALEKEGARR